LLPNLRGQIDLCFAQELTEIGFYIARPYNFNISPLVAQDRTVKDRFPDRDITFDSNATSFLVREGFDIGKIFTSGVPYLSYVEEGEGLHRYRARTGDERSKKVQPPATIEALDFLKHARATILDWINNPKVYIYAIWNPETTCRKADVSSLHMPL
jgi:poly(A)-specific ribonuclease